MISTEITSRNFEADTKIKAYINEKIGGLEKYVPKAQRATASAQIVIQDDPSGREDNRFVCHGIVIVNGNEFVAKEGTVNMYAAVDIVEAKLKSQLAVYKEKNAPQRGKIMDKLFHREEELQESAESAEVL